MARSVSWAFNNNPRAEKLWELNGPGRGYRTKRRYPMSDTTKIAPDRAKIAMEDDEQVKYWTRHLGVSREDLERVVEKVGNSVASVRKELDGKLRPSTPDSKNGMLG
jgi:hypothetical protein